MTTKKPEPKATPKKTSSLDDIRAAVLEIDRVSSDPAVKNAVAKALYLIDQHK